MASFVFDPCLPANPSDGTLVFGSRDRPVVKVFQKCSKSLCDWAEKGSTLSESRSPEFVQVHEKYGKE
jgi:hypothetical protein